MFNNVQKTMFPREQ